MVDSKCSRAGCTATAVLRLNWRNPKIHDESRIKTWHACPEHSEYLIDYLTSRGFFIGKEDLGIR